MDIIPRAIQRDLEESKQMLRKEMETWAICLLIFINWPTGSGKSHIVNHEMDDLAESRHWKMVILCNRRSLREEYIKNRQEIDALKNRVSAFCHVFLYQEIEGNSDNAKQKRKIIEAAQLIICDEVHYFCKDALFNPNTADSFDFLVSRIPFSIVVCMSATIQAVKPLIMEAVMDNFHQAHNEWEMHEEKRLKKNREKIVHCYDRFSEEALELKRAYEEADSANRERLERDEPADIVPVECFGEDGWEQLFYFPPDKEPVCPDIKEYEADRDVSGNYQVHIFGSEDLVEKICKEYPGKTLIFVQSKKRGKELERQFASILEKKQVVYIDADYDACKDEKASEEMKRITQDNTFSAKVCIVTPVLDNGVNLLDENIRNIVIFTEDEIDFKQMIGRRRINDNTVVNLFIFRSSASHFKSRFRKYLKNYWKLCKDPELSFKGAYKKLKEATWDQEELMHFFQESENGLKTNKLGLAECRRRIRFCFGIWHRMEQDPDYFVKLQYSWIGQNPDPDALRKAEIEYSELDEAEIDKKLSEYETVNGGFISNDDFNDFKKILISTVAKQDREWRNKKGKLEDVNRLLSDSEKWGKYQFKKYKLKEALFFELIVNGRQSIEIAGSLDLEGLKEILDSCGDKITDQVFEELTSSSIPKCLSGNRNHVIALLNEKMKDVEALSGYQIKDQSGAGKLQATNRSKRGKKE